jgi:hypothetical protein
MKRMTTDDLITAYRKYLTSLIRGGERKSIVVRCVMRHQAYPMSNEMNRRVWTGSQNPSACTGR